MGGQVLLHRVLALEACAAKLAMKLPQVPVDGGGVSIQVRPLSGCIRALGAAHQGWRGNNLFRGGFRPAFVTSSVPVEEELASCPVFTLQAIVVSSLVLSLRLHSLCLNDFVFVLDVLL